MHAACIGAFYSKNGSLRLERIVCNQTMRAKKSRPSAEGAERFSTDAVRACEPRQ